MNQNEDADQPVDIEDIYPLTYLQQGILFHTLNAPASGIYCPRYAYTVEGPLDVERLEWAWQRVIARHAVLRTAIIWDEAQEPLQVVLRRVDFRIATEDWTEFAPAEQQRLLDAFLEREGSRGHDLASAPLLRVSVFRFTPALSKVAMSFHHLVLDGWSVGIVLKEVFTLYHARSGGKVPQLPEAPSFREFVKQARRQDPEAENFFRSELAGISRATLLGEVVGSKTLDQGGGSCSLALATDVTRRLERCARACQVTLSTLLEAGYALLLGRRTGTTDVLFGTTVSGRSSGAEGIDHLVGLCINTLPTRVRIDDAAPIDEWLRHLHARLVAMRSFEQMPLTAIRRLSDIPAMEPLFESILVIENYPMDRALARRVGAFQVTSVTGVEDTNFPLAMIAMVSDQIVFDLKYDKSSFSEAAATSLLKQYATLLDALTNGENARVGDLTPVSEAERRQVVREWNATTSVYDRERLIHELFDEQAEKSPDRVVLEDGGKRLTYDELRRRSNQLARYLIRQGVSAEQPVAICVERSERLLIAIFGILKAGGAYLPLDPQYPKQRTRFMLDQSRTSLLITESERLPGLPDALPTQVLLDLDAAQIDAESGDAPHVLLRPENLAYVIYTSGSTGEPKGVAVEHRNTVAFVHWCRGHVREQDLRGVFASTSVCFDVSVFELIAAPCLGARLVLAKDILALADVAASDAVTLVSTVPSAMAVLSQATLPPSLRVIHLAGEAVESSLVRALHAHPQVEEVWNLYGPTEDTTYSTAARLDPADVRPPVGRPIANGRAYVLDRHLKLVVPGVTGEIYLGGAGVSRGYLGRPDLTAERFVPDPFGAPGDRLYKTGDRGRHRSDGMLEYLGRNDGQLKIRGYRVELGEIEAALRALPAVDSAVVTAWQDDQGGSHLNAHFTTKSQRSIAAHELKGLLEASLPKYMVPEAFVQLDALPRLPNGKIDRGAIKPTPLQATERSFVSARTLVEERLSRIIREVLGLTRIGVHDDFFAVGMHSLNATRAAGRVRQAFALDLPLRTLFEARTVEALAAHVEAGLAELRNSEGSAEATTSEALALSYAQERVWLFEQLQPGLGGNQRCFILSLAGDLHLDSLARALDELVTRNDVLRARFALGPEGVEQRIAPAFSVAMPWIDLGNITPHEFEQELERRADQERSLPFALDRGRLVRAQLVRRSQTEHWLFLTLHALACDERSGIALLAQIAELYESFAGGERARDFGRQYLTYSTLQRQRRSSLESLLEARRAELADAPTRLELPTDRPRPALQTFSAREHSATLTESACTAVEELARSAGTTASTLLLSAFSVLLSRYTGCKTLLIGLSSQDPCTDEPAELLGPLTNLLPVRVDLDGDPTFAELLVRTERAVQVATASRELPFELLLEALEPERDLSRPALCQVRFASRPLAESARRVRDLTLELVTLPKSNTAFDLELLLEAEGACLRLNLVYNAALFEPETVARLATHFQVLLRDILARPETKLSRLSLLTQEELQRVLVEWNGTAAELAETPVHELIAQTARSSPQAIAIVAGELRVSHLELEQRSNRLARYLMSVGVGPEVRVALAVSRSVEQIVSLLAVLKAGGVYVPIDVDQPAKRLAYVLEDAGARFVIADEACAGSLPRNELDRILLHEIGAEVARRSAEPLTVAVRPQNLAYVIFTSGSTGRPKGVEVTHRGLSNYLAWTTTTYFAGSVASSPLHAPLTFDLSVTSFFCPLLAGVPVELVDDEPGAEGLRRLVAADAPKGVIKLTPAHLALLAEARGTIESLVIGGEALGYEHVAALRRSSPSTRLYNEYGPTETVVGCSVHLITPDEPHTGPVPIGRPIANTTLYVLDARYDALPVGVPGELFIGGLGLARGYSQRPDLSAASFVPNPYGAPGERMYSTGDRARYRADGTLEYLGRIDQQIKLRGFRIEPGEIESALLEDERIENAVVVVREDVPDDRRLIGYYTVRSGSAIPEPSELKHWLGERLPGYMRPALLVELAAFPLTAHGKIDRSALPEPEYRGSARASREPKSETERCLLQIFAGVLRMDGFGVEDDFFELGGHSVLATLLIGRVRQAFGLELPLRAVFEAPNVAGLATRLDELAERGAYSSAIPAQGRDLPLPLSFAQQRLWFLDQLNPGDASYNNPIATRVRGPLDVPALEHALNELVNRHEVLRAAFGSSEGKPTLDLTGAIRPSLAQIDLSALEHAERESVIERLAAQDALKPFDLSHGPLLRVTLLRCAPEHHALLFTMHHIVCDGWSLTVLSDELAALYEAHRQGRPAELSPLPIQYADFAVWQRGFLTGEPLQQRLDYWRRQLEGAPQSIALPTDREQRVHGRSPGRTFSFRISAALSRKVNEFSIRLHATPFMTLLSAFLTLLHRYSGQTDLVVGTPIANRNRLEIEGLIGFFVNTLALRVNLAQRPSFLELVLRTREVALGAYANQDLPFDRLVEELNPARTGGGASPFFQVMFVLQNVPGRELSVAGLTLEPLIPETQTSKFDLTLLLGQADDGLLATFEYNTDLFDETTIERMARHFEAVLQGALAHPEQAIDRHPLLGNTERALLAAFNETKRQHGSAGVLRSIEQRAAENPRAVALVFEGNTLSYGELSRRTNQLARELQSLGVERDARVAVLFERSLEMVIALLSVLKAGGAYVPLDPGHPATRLAVVLADSGARVVLTQQPLLARLPEGGARVVCVDTDWRRIAGHSDAPLSELPAPTQLAYVLYTSGSTGSPKGVSIEHRALDNHMAWLLEAFEFTAKDVVLQKTPYVFDASVWEFYAPLMVGAKLVLARPDGHRDASYLAQAIIEHEVSVLQLVPTGLALLLEQSTFKHASSLTRVFSGGEVLSPELARNFFRVSPARLYNLYGPTEACIDASSYECRRNAGEERVAIGKPIDNVRIHVLDAECVPVPIGALGELYIGGSGLARGYLSRPDLSAERFVPDPFGQHGDRLYRTGDIGRYRSDGQLEYFGRLDQQVKLRGFRVELGEVESQLLQHPSIAQAVVVLVGAEQRQKLVAYYTLKDGQVDAGHHELRSHLKERLPEHMLPARMQRLESLPLLPSGKVNRAALPALDAVPIEAELTLPRTVVEQQLAAVFAEVLGVERVGINDDFFELGGHSLLATQVVTRIHARLGVPLPLRAIFEASTVFELAEQVVRGPRAARVPPPLTAAAREGALPLSHPQERLWTLDQMHPGQATYNVPFAVRLRGTLDVLALAKTLHAIVERHEPLRTRFLVVDGQPAQLVEPQIELALVEVDLSCLPVNEREAEVQRLLEQEASRPFDLAKGPPLRLALLKCEERDHVVVGAMHHIVCDGWSMSVLAREVTALYEAFRSGKPAPLPKPAIQYADYACWQRSWLCDDVMRSELDYWRRKLSDAPAALQLPIDRPRPAERAWHGAIHSFPIPSDICQRLQHLCRRERVTLYMAMLAAFHVLLRRHTGQADMVLGSPIANRNHPLLEDLIGFFLNTMAVRIDSSKTSTFRQLLAEVREAALGAYAHQDAPFEKIVEVVNPERDPQHWPLFQVMFVLQNAPVTALTLPELTLEPLLAETQKAKFDLTFVIEQNESELVGTFQYDSELFEARSIERLARRFERLVQGILADPDQAIEDLPLLPDEERELVLGQFNESRLSDVPGELVHERFDRQAARVPRAQALVFEGGTLDYAELTRRSNRLAHWLRRRAEGEQATVALFFQAPAELVVAMLAALKAGIAFIPLDSGWSEGQLDQVLRAAAPSLIVTSGESAKFLPKTAFPVVCLDAAELLVTETERSPAPPRTNHRADALACVLYGTQGETVKGVEIEHRALRDQLHWMLGAFSFDERDRVVTRLQFGDRGTLWPLFLPLLSGGRSVLLSDGDATSLSRLIEEQHITALALSPAELRRLVDHEAFGRLSSLTRVFVENGVLQSGLVDRFFESSQARLYQLYGSAEAGIGSSFECRAGAAQGTVPIGRPVPGSESYVLDSKMNLAPIGTAGELFIGGPLARGIAKRADWTAESFVPHPFSTKPGARLYRTRYRARFAADGTLHLLGRCALSLKLRGLRVELGEIETALCREPAVEDAVVLALGSGAPPRLAAAVTSKVKGRTLDVRALERSLSASLPAYLVPTVYASLEQMPLLANGTLDRDALAALVASLPPLRRAAPSNVPRDALELGILRIWEELLNVSDVRLSDNFFDLGGHSLLATRMMHAVEQRLGVHAPVAALFAAPTIVELASRLRLEAPADASPLLEIHGRGSYRPLFCVHPAGGSSAGYVELSRALGPEQPLYGLDAPGIRGDAAIFTRVEDMAECYVQAIRSVQPHGPYQLAGWSLGGVIAFEMARQLRKAGETVAPILLLDTPAPSVERRLGQQVPSDPATALAELAGHPLSDLTALPLSEWNALSEAERFEEITLRLQARDALPTDVPVAELKRLVLVYQRQLEAFSLYSPARSAEPLVLFRPERTVVESELDPTLGWREFTSEEVRVQLVPGSHESMVRGPDVMVLAEALRRLLHAKAAA